MKWTLIFVTLVLAISNLQAHFFNEKAKGWHWYQPAVGSDRQRDIASDM